MVSLQDLPKKVQYIIVDSEFVNGTNNTFTIDLSLKSNLHVEEISEVIGIKPVDFYITQVGENDLGNTNVAKYIDIVCDDVPKRGQILNERNGQILARVPLERSFTGSNDFIMRDKQWRSFQRQTNLFNPISIQKLNFKIYESQGDGDYKTLQPDANWYMVLEITTIDVKEKPINREVQILEALHKLIGKIDDLNVNVKKLPDKEDIEKMEIEKKKKYPLRYLILFITMVIGGFVFVKNKFTPSIPQPSF
ncbi:hypothetical protein BpV2_198c [Bathycoccus sp. RCC1105 virus BpV2]|nr:hypothetical protein BpV2_198c [Bathycoccus sp. RCC1105 virus BpV2]